MKKIWSSVELSKVNAKHLRNYLHNMNIQFETSEVDNLIHFECLVTEQERAKANRFLDMLYREEKEK